MLIIKVKEGENMERVLKRFKRKVNETKMVRQLRERQQFIKPSVTRRKEIMKAEYIQKLRDEEGKD